MQNRQNRNVEHPRIQLFKHTSESLHESEEAVSPFQKYFEPIDIDLKQDDRAPAAHGKRGKKVDDRHFRDTRKKKYIQLFILNFILIVHDQSKKVQKHQIQLLVRILILILRIDNLPIFNKFFIIRGRRNKKDQKHQLITNQNHNRHTILAIPFQRVMGENYPIVISVATNLMFRILRRNTTTYNLLQTFQ